MVIITRACLLLPLIGSCLSYISHHPHRLIRPQCAVTLSDQHTPTINRRAAISAATLAVAGMTGITSQPAAARDGPRVKGAAELDLEFYLDNLLGTQFVQKPPQKIPRPPSRSLQPALASSVLRLTDMAIIGYSSLGPSDLGLEKQRLRDKYRTEFEVAADTDLGGGMGPGPGPGALDQYSFDLESYVQFKIAGKAIPDLKERARFIREVGSNMYSQVYQPQAAPVPVKEQGVAKCKDGILAMLGQMQSTQLVASFKLEADDLDDEVLIATGQASFILYVDEPASLQATYFLSSEGTRFHPDVVAAPIASYLQACGLKASYDELLLDTVYRPNPADYRPNQIVSQWTVSL